MCCNMASCVLLFVTVTAVLASTTADRRKLERERYRHRNAERRLFDDITRIYDEGTRPVLKANTTVSVNFSISLHQIMDLDEKNQTLITHVWVYEEWVDEVLRWIPERYDHTETIILPSERIWLPDLYIFNNADKGDEGFVVVNESRAIVHYTGRVEWIIPLMIKSSCNVDVQYFPFDNQHCFVRFGSWIYDAKQLDLIKKRERVDLSNFVTNSEFDLISMRLERDLVGYEMFDGTYPQITMHMHIRRKPLYYMYTVIAPTLVLCILTMFTFMLPCDNGGKVGIGLTVFLSLYVLQLAVAENIPESNSLPLLGLFLTLVMTLNAISLLFATLVINIKKKGERKPCPEVPKILWFFCKEILAKLTCTKLISFHDLYDPCENDTSGGDVTEEEFSSQEEELEGATGGMMKQQQNRVKPDKDNALNDISDVKRLYQENYLPDKINVERDLKHDWFFVAQVLDKSLFILFFTAMMLTIMLTLVVVPYLHRND